MGLIYVRIMSFFSFPTHTRAYFSRQITKDYKMFSMWLQNRDKTETHNTLCNFSKSPYMFRSHGYMALFIMRLVYFALYKWLAVCSCEYSLSGCFMRHWLVWALSVRERECVWRFFVFVSVDVKYIIHYKRICKFICSL